MKVNSASFFGRLPSLLTLSSLFLLNLNTAVKGDEIEVQGTKVPSIITCSECPLVLNGTAVRKKFGFSVYVAALYLDAKSRDDADIMEKNRLNKRVHITMLREVSSDAFNSSILDNIDTNFSTAEKQKFSEELKRFLGCFDGGSELKKGSIINIDFVPENGTLVTVDGNCHELIPGEEFYHAILRLWIGNPPQKSLKTGLLGLAID